MTETVETAAEHIPEAGSALVLAVNEKPSIVLLDDQRRAAFFAAVEDEVARHVPDLTTVKGRDAVRSLARKVTTTKTAIDAAGKALKEDAQKTVNMVDAARRESRLRLEALAVTARQPLTDWEVREQVRVEKVDGIIKGLQTDAIVSTTETAEDVAARLERVEGSELDPEVMGDRLEEAQGLHATAVAVLQGALTRIRQEEADRAELDRLRAAEAEREAKQAEKLAAYEAAKAAQREAAKAEDARVAYVGQIMEHISEVGRGMIGGKPYPYVILIRELEEKITPEPRLEPDWPRIDAHRAETLAHVKRAAEVEAARTAAEQQAAEAARVGQAQREAAEAARAEQQRAHEEALAAEKRRADELEDKRKAEAAEAAREAEAAAARAADREHRGKVMAAAKQAIMGHGVGEATAKAIVLAIAAGEVPAVKIEF